MEAGTDGIKAKITNSKRQIIRGNLIKRLHRPFGKMACATEFYCVNAPGESKRG